MKVEQLRQLIAIIKHGSINKAAQELYISQSALSASIKNLETELGTNIIERNSKGISLTPYGAVVYHQATMICAEIDFLQTISPNAKTAPLALDVSHMYSPIATDVFIQLYNKYQNQPVRLSIRECSTLETIANVQSGISEIGIVTLFSNTRALYLRSILLYRLEYHKLTDRPIYVVVGKQNPLYYSDKACLELGDLDDYAFAFYNDLITEASMRQLFVGQRRKKSDISLSTLESLLHLIANTDAFTLEAYNPSLLSTVSYENELRFIPFNHSEIHCEFGWIHNQDRIVSPLAEDFISHLKQSVEELPDIHK